MPSNRVLGSWLGMSIVNLGLKISNYTLTGYIKIYILVDAKVCINSMIFLTLCMLGKS